MDATICATGRRPSKADHPATPAYSTPKTRPAQQPPRMLHITSSALASTLRPITLGDRALFDAAFSRLADPISDASFASCYLWSQTLSLSWEIAHEHLCVYSSADDEMCLILPPMALSDASESCIKACLDACFARMDDYNTPRAGIARSRIEYVSDELLDKLRSHTAPPLSAAPMYADYVYPARAMIDLDGGPLKGKRKLRNGFLRDHPNVRTAELRSEDTPQCLALLDRWKQHADEAHEGECNEQCVGADRLRAHDDACTRLALRDHRALGLETMAVWDGDHLIGFTLGERLGPASASVLIEKVEPGVRGAAQFIYSEFCRQRFSGCDTINAGDDWGLEPLRYTKASYRPTRLISKSVLTRPEAIHPMTTQPTDILVIRDASLADVDGILDIEQSSFTRRHERFDEAQVRRLIQNPRADVVVAELDGHVIGWASALTRRTSRGFAGRLYAVAVSPEARGRGAGRALTVAALRSLRTRGVSTISLEVRSDNAVAVALYASLGFHSEEALPNYYGMHVHGVRMRRREPDPVI